MKYNSQYLSFLGKGREELETSDIEDDLSSYVSNLSYQQHIDRESLGEGSKFFSCYHTFDQQYILCLDLLNHEDFTSNTELRVLDSNTKLFISLY